jgi:hypothetical protein
MTRRSALLVADFVWCAVPFLRLLETGKRVGKGYRKIEKETEEGGAELRSREHQLAAYWTFRPRFFRLAGSEGMPVRFVHIDHDTPLLLPPDLRQ